MARILLAEDDTSMREYLQRALQRVGYEVSAVGCGTEAVPLLESEQFDLLLTDIVMPQVHGFALARMAKVRRPSLRVLYMSGYNDLPQHERGMAFGKVVEKPSEPEKLVEEVRAALA